MDHIEEVLMTFEENSEYDTAIREAIGIARRTLNCYYSLTNTSEVYRICMSASNFSLSILIS